MKTLPFLTALVLIPFGGGAQLPAMPRVSNVWVVPNQSAVRFELLDEASPIAQFAVARAPFFSVSWPAGKLRASNGESADAAPALEKEGRFGRPLTQDLSVTIQPEKFSQKQPAWLAVTVWDGGAPGGLKIDGPAALTFPLHATGRWVTRTFALENFDAALSRNTLTFHAVKSSGDAPVLLGAASLFVTKNLEAGEIVELGATPGRNSVTLIARKLPWDPKLVRHFLLTGRDQAGQNARPVAIDPGELTSSVLARLPLSE